MDKNHTPPGDFPMEQAAAFINSPAGRQLAKILQQRQDSSLDQAITNAASGNMEQAKASISGLLKDPQIQALLRQFGGSDGRN